MSEIVSLAIDSIVVPAKRLRELDETQAQLIASSVKESGQFQPIAVHHSSRAAKPYTLIFGLHRYRAHQILGLTEISVVIRAASEAPMLEIAENLFRHDLTELDRSAFAKEWFTLKGVKMGRPKKSAKLADFFVGIGLSERASKELGFSGRTGQRLCQIADKLHPNVKALLRGTPAANNQSILLKLAKLGPDDQVKIAAALEAHAIQKLCVSLLEQSAQ